MWQPFTLHEMLYVDDVVLFAESAEALDKMVLVFHRICRTFGQQLNAAKSKVLVVNPTSTQDQDAQTTRTCGNRKAVHMG